MTGDDVTQPDYGVYRQQASQPCWECGYRTDAAGELPGAPRRRPAAGDFSICFRCGEVAVFTGQGLLKRQPTEAGAGGVRHRRRLGGRADAEIRVERPLG